MTYNFKNYAIKCDEWSQMEELARVAVKQGATTENILFSLQDFEEGHVYFVLETGTYLNVPPHLIDTDYSNLTTFKIFINQNK